MHASSPVRSTTRPRPASALALRGFVAVEILVMAAGALLVAGPFDARGGTGSPLATPRVSPATPSTASPSVEPTRPGSAPTAVPTLTPVPSVPTTPAATRPPMPLPTTAPGTIAPSRPPGTVAPSRPPVAGGPPPCAYLDVITPYHRYEDWSRTLLDPIHRLPASYAPRDLVDTSVAGLNGGYRVRGLIIEDLRSLAAAAAAAGAPIQLVSAYRSYEQQRATFQRWVDIGGYEQALRTSARPGHSEHQLGTTIDLTSRGGVAPWNYADWAATPSGAWIARNAWRHGFIVTYPRGSFDRTCYDYEPWHLRYFGRERARAIVESGLTAREFLWTLR